MLDREKLKEKIRALREMTSARGCTEDEAMVAAAKAAELMREYGVSNVELETESADAKAKTHGTSVRDQIVVVIMDVTNTAAIFNDSGIRFYGVAPGPEIAAYIWTICNRAIDRGVRIFKTGRLYRARRSDRTRREAVADFTQGMVNRLARRIVEIFGNTRSEAALAKAKQALAIANPQTKKVTPSTSKGEFWDARAEGWTAADGVTLGHGIKSEAHGAAQIGEGPKLLENGR
jgi:hypothetical protein